MKQIKVTPNSSFTRLQFEIRTTGSSAVIASIENTSGKVLKMFRWTLVTGTNVAGIELGKQVVAAFTVKIHDDFLQEIYCTTLQKNISAPVIGSPEGSG